MIRWIELIELVWLAVFALGVAWLCIGFATHRIR